MAIDEIQSSCGIKYLPNYFRPMYTVLGSFRILEVAAFWRVTVGKSATRGNTCID